MYTQLFILDIMSCIVVTFTHLGSVISYDSGTEKDIQAKLVKTTAALNLNIKSVLLDGSESWKVTKTDMRQKEAFHL